MSLLDYYGRLSVNRFFLLFLLLSTSLYAGEIGRKRAYQERIQSEFGITEYPEVGSCRYELYGKNLKTEFVYEDDLMNFKTCLSKAASALEANRMGFRKVRVKHQSKDKWELFEKK